MNKDSVELVLPGWDYSKRVTVPNEKLPAYITREICKGFRFHGEANLAAKTEKELELNNFTI